MTDNHFPPVKSVYLEDEHVGEVGAAVDSVHRLAIELTSAIDKLHYPDSARLRQELEHAVAHLKERVEAVPLLITDAMQIGELITSAKVAITVAPQPSSTAVEQAERGDDSLWRAEEQAWMISRMGHVVAKRFPRRRSHSRDTRPESPSALREIAPMPDTEE